MRRIARSTHVKEWSVFPSAATLPELLIRSKLHHSAWAVKASLIFANALMFSIFSFGVIINDEVP